MLNPIDYSISKFISFADAEALAQIDDIAETVTFKKGNVIETRGDTADYIYLIKEGLVQLGINGIDGSRFNLTRLGPGHTFGETALFLNHAVIYDTNAKTDVVLKKLSRPNIDHLMTHSLMFSKALLSVACMRVETTLSHIADSLGMSLQARVAKRLLSISESANDAHIISVRQIDLAHSLGVSRVSIGKTLKDLSRQGLITIGYGKIEMSSRSRLIDIVQKSERHV